MYDKSKYQQMLKIISRRAKQARRAGRTSLYESSGVLDPQTLRPLTLSEIKKEYGTQTPQKLRQIGYMARKDYTRLTKNNFKERLLEVAQAEGVDESVLEEIKKAKFSEIQAKVNSGVWNFFEIYKENTIGYSEAYERNKDGSFKLDKDGKRILKKGVTGYYKSEIERLRVSELL